MFTLGELLVLVFKLVLLCFFFVALQEGIDLIKRLVKYWTIGKYNHYSTKVINKVTERKEVPYVKTNKPIGEVVDISSLIKIIPKLVANINVLTGDIEKRDINVWKNRGICERLLHPWNRGRKETVEIIPQTVIVKKYFVYTQSLINTLNLHYPNWMKLNPELINVVKGPIVAEEVIIPYLKHFQK